MFNYLSDIRVFNSVIKYEFDFPEELQRIFFLYKTYINYLE